MNENCEFAGRLENIGSEKVPVGAELYKFVVITFPELPLAPVGTPTWKVVELIPDQPIGGAAVVDVLKPSVQGTDPFVLREMVEVLLVKQLLPTPRTL